MCYLCLRDDIFAGKEQTEQARLRERAAHIKQLIADAESRRDKMCYVGDAAIELLKKEQYEIARKL